MLAIRLQRHGRKGYPTYRIAVQEAQRHPTSGRVVAYVGSFNPHTKEVTIDVEKITLYLGNGAQPTPRVVKILLEQKVKLPNWVIKHTGEHKASLKHGEKLRKNRPVEPVAEPAEEAVAEPEEAKPDEAAPEEKPAE